MSVSPEELTKEEEEKLQNFLKNRLNLSEEEETIEQTSVEESEQSNYPILDALDQTPVAYTTPGKVALGAARLGKRLYGGFQGLAGSFQRTGAVTAEKLGFQEQAKNLREASDLNREQAAETVYKNQYGDTGLEQFKNLEDENWWIDTIGAVIPGSIPFLTGAATGGYSALKMTKNPYAALVGAMGGGALAVYAQSYGDAYDEYLEKFPNDIEGASDYAFNVSGLSSLINAASIPLGFIGLGTAPLKHYLIQAMIQGSVGSADTTTQNYQAKSYGVDPDRDLSTGLAPSFVGEAIAEAPILTSTVRKASEIVERSPEEQAQEIQEQAEAERDNIEDQAERAVKFRLKNIAEKYAERKGLPYDKDIKDLERNELLEIIEEEKLEIRTVPEESSESLYNKIVESIETQAMQERIKDRQRRLVGSKQTLDDLEKEQKMILDEMSPEQLADEIEKDFGSPEVYRSWALDQGALAFDPEESSSNYEQDKAALARAKATVLFDRRRKPLWVVGRDKIDTLVEEYKNQHTIEELREMVYEFYTPEELTLRQGTDAQRAGTQFEDAPALTKGELTADEAALLLAEIQGIIDNQNEKLNLTTGTSFLGKRKSFLKRVQFKPQEQTEKELIFKEHIAPNGNALTAKIEVPVPEGSQEKPIVISFRRRGLDVEGTLAEQMASGGANLVAVRAEGVPEEGVIGKTIQELRDSFPESYIKEFEIPINRSPHVRQNGTVDRILGMYNRMARPLMSTGAMVGGRYKQLQGRLRSMDQFAQYIGLEVERAILKAIDKGEVTNKEEADKLLMAFLRKTGAKVTLTEEDKSKYKKEIERLERSRYDSDNRGNTARQNQIEDEISRLEIAQEGLQKESVVLQQLPESLRKVAAEVRTGIDSLSQRLLDELPRGFLDAEQRQVIEENLNRYVTRSFAIFEPKLGFNPAFMKKFGTFFENSKKAQELYERGVIAMESELKDNLPDYEARVIRENRTATPEEVQQEARKILREEAEARVDEIINTAMYQNAYDVMHLAGLKKPHNAKTGFLKAEGLLSEKGFIPYAIRQLMGEINEANLVAATSFARIAKLIETQNFYSELIRINDMPGEMWFSPQLIPGSYEVKIETEDSLNPLNGYYTTQDMYEAVVDRYNPADHQNIVWNTYVALFGGAQALTQYGMIVISPGTQMRNIYGAAMMLLFNGHVGADYSEATRVIMQDIFGNSEVKEGDPEALAAKRKMDELGVTTTAAQLGDTLGVLSQIRDGGIKSVGQFVDIMYALRETPVGQGIDKTLGAANRLARKTYAATDDYFKILAFGSERLKLKTLLNNLQDQNGNVLPDEIKLNILREFAESMTSKSDFGGMAYSQNLRNILRNVTTLEDYIDNLAAYLVRNTMPNYDYVGRFAEYIRLLPYGNFIAFPTEILRTSANSALFTKRLASYRISDELMQQGNIAKETILLSRKEDQALFKVNPRPFKSMAMKRLIGGAFAGGGAVALTQTMGQLLFNVDDDELDALSVVGAEYSRNQNIIPMGPIRSKEEGGGTVGTSAAYIAPYESLHELLNVITRQSLKGEYTADPVTLDNAVVTFAIELASPYTDRSISQRVIDQLRINMDLDTYKPVYLEGDDMGVRVIKMVKFALDETQPGLTRQLSDLIWSLEEGDARFNEYGEEMSVMRALAKLMGLSTTNINPDKSFPFVLNNSIGRFRREVPTSFRRARGSGEVTEEMILDMFYQSNYYFFKLQQELYFVSEQFKKVNLSDEQYDKQMKRYADQAGVPKLFVSNIQQGVFTPYMPTPGIVKSFFEETEKNQLNRTWPFDEINDRHKFMIDNKISLTANPELNRELRLNALKKED
jgi:hypothetical protein